MIQNKRFRPIYFWMLLLLLLLIFLNIPFLNVLTIRQGDTGNVLFSAPVKRQEPFYIRYIHSIHRTPVTEKYYIDGNMNLVVDEMIFESYGVGIPSELEPGQTFTEKEGKFVLGNLNRHLPYIDQRIGQEIANHTLLYRHKEIPLSEIGSPGSWVRLQADKETILQQWGRRFWIWLNKTSSSK